MFCPNCGASNNKKQNYCRFCRLNLRDTAKSLKDQIVFGEESALLKKLSTVRRAVDVLSTVVIGVLLAGIAAYLFFIDQKFGMDLIKISLVVFFGLKTVQETIGYFQRRARKGNKTLEPTRGTELEGAPTAKLLEDRPFEPAHSVVEEPTELLNAEKETAKL